MREQIIKHLREIEQTRNVRIVFACEAGSRAYGTDTSESDHDVRFVFVQPLRSYISIVPAEKVIVSNPAPKLEFHGWDLFKALELTQKSNPTLYEWMSSPMIYVKDNEFYQKMKEIIHRYYSLSNIAKHYQSLAEKNLKELTEKKLNTLAYAKTYLQALRGILAVRWIVTHKRLPPLAFSELSDGNAKIKKLVSLLTKAKTEDFIDLPAVSVLQEMLEDTRVKLAELPPVKKIDVQQLNHLAWMLLNI